LHGLSPWSQGRRANSRPRAARISEILGAMDERGAWTEPGTIGKANKVISVFAARDMVLTINGKPQTIRENDDIVLYEGTQPPRGRIVRSTTFAENLEALAAWLTRD
jgi:hypothetical protein